MQVCRLILEPAVDPAPARSVELTRETAAALLRTSSQAFEGKPRRVCYCPDGSKCQVGYRAVVCTCVHPSGLLIVGNSCPRLLRAENLCCQDLSSVLSERLSERRSHQLGIT